MENSNSVFMTVLCRDLAVKTELSLGSCLSYPKPNSNRYQTYTEYPDMLHSEGVGKRRNHKALVGGWVVVVLFLFPSRSSYTMACSQCLVPKSLRTAK